MISKWTTLFGMSIPLVIRVGPSRHGCTSGARHGGRQVRGIERRSEAGDEGLPLVDVGRLVTTDGAPGAGAEGLDLGEVHGDGVGVLDCDVHVRADEAV